MGVDYYHKHITLYRSFSSLRSSVSRPTANNAFGSFEDVRQVPRPAGPTDVIGTQESLGAGPTDPNEYETPPLIEQARTCIDTMSMAVFSPLQGVLSPDKVKELEAKMSTALFEMFKGLHPVSDDAESTDSSPANAAATYSDVKYIPYRYVKVNVCLFHNEAASSPDYTPLAQAFLARLNNKDIMQATLQSQTRSGQVRDPSTTSLLMSFIGETNDSWLDVAPMLRALLYAFAAPKDSFSIDTPEAKLLYGFRSRISDEYKVNYSKLKTDTTHLEKTQVMVVTYTAFGDIVENTNPYLAGRYSIDMPFCSNVIDEKWVALPLDARNMSEDFVLELIMAFLPSDNLTGNMSFCWSSKFKNFVDNTKSYHAYFTGVPVSRCNIVDGHNIMIVLVDDHAYTRRSTYTIPGTQTEIKVYPGGRNSNVDAMNTYISDITALIAARIETHEKFASSAERMVSALAYMERYYSHQGAMRMAVSVASELAISYPMGSSVVWSDTANKTSQYDSTLSAAYAFGEAEMGGKDFKTKSLVASDTEADRTKLMTSLMNTFNFCQHSPMGRYPNAFVQMEHTKGAAVPSTNFFDYSVTSKGVSTCMHQYRTHHSVYRVMTAI